VIPVIGHTGSDVIFVANPPTKTTHFADSGSTADFRFYAGIYSVDGNDRASFPQLR
jgi:hypothetical protein